MIHHHSSHSHQHHHSSHHRRHPASHPHHKRSWPHIWLNLFLVGISLFLLQKSIRLVSHLPEVAQMNPLMPATPSPTPFTHYTVPQIPRKEFYTIFFVGDSMTDALGPHPFKFSQLINEAYEQSFIIDNYSQGSANILMLEELLNKSKDVDGLHMEAPLTRPFDILVVESFGHNPLSDMTRQDGYGKQKEVLDTLMKKIMESHPQAVVIFLATIPPDEINYAKGTFDLPPELRASYARERKDYIENFITYANEHNIPLIDIYHQSFNADGTVKREYISRDNIHPSQVGIEFIQQRIFEFIMEKQYLPK